MAIAIFKARQIALRDRGVEGLLSRLYILGQEEFAERVPDDLARLVTQNQFPGGIRGSEDAVGADDHEQGAGIEPYPVTFRGALRHLLFQRKRQRAQLLLRPTALDD